LTQIGRRAFVGFSAFALSVLAGLEPERSARAQAGAGDAGFLNLALEFEHKAVAAYTIGAGSGLLSTNAMLVATRFRGHHEQHRDALASVLNVLGVKPAEAMPQQDYAKALKAELLRSEADVLTLAIGMEKKAASTYLGAISIFGDHDHAALAAKIAADEAMHWTALAGFLGRSLPEEALSFG
jgi:hypothetical protein